MSELPAQIELRDISLAIRDGTHGTHKRMREGVPFLSAKNITPRGTIHWDKTDEKISQREFNTIHKAFQLQEDDVLLTIVGTLGRRAVYSGENVTFQRSVAYIRPDKTKVLSRFLFHCMGHDGFLSQIKRRSNATAQAGLYLGELGQVSVPTFCHDHQSKIAEILDTLDAAIRGTEAVVAKLKAMKQGLLHDLLTRGIDANGDLRPPQPEAPHLYKQTPLGWLPKEWDALPLGDYTQHDITSGIVHAGPHIEGGIPYIRTGDMSGVALVRERMLCTSERIASSFRRSEVRAGELVIAIRATLGKVLPVPVDLDGANLTQGTARISPKLSVNSTCLMFAIRHERGQVAIMKEVKGSTFMEISLSSLRQVLIALPLKRSEQDRIADRLTEHEDAISAEQKLLDKLRFQKIGLMDDLLTGRVPVTPLL